MVNSQTSSGVKDASAHRLISVNTVFTIVYTFVRKQYLQQGNTSAVRCKTVAQSRRYRIADTRTVICAV